SELGCEEIPHLPLYQIAGVAQPAGVRAAPDSIDVRLIVTLRVVAYAMSRRKLVSYRTRNSQELVIALSLCRTGVKDHKHVCEDNHTFLNTCQPLELGEPLRYPEGTGISFRCQKGT